jgi:hypothetical protein
MASAVVEDRFPRFEGGESPAGIAFANPKPCNAACVSALEDRDAGVFSVNNSNERQWRLIGLRGL